MLKISILLYLIIPTLSISLFICFLNNVVSLNNYHYDQILMGFFLFVFLINCFCFFLWYRYFLLFLYSNPFMVLPVKIEKATCLSTCLSYL